MTDRRAAILARCDELELIAKLACDAADPEDHGEWDPLGSGVVLDNQMRRVTSPVPGRIPTVRADAIGSHIATWDPAMVLTLIVGIRKLCEMHTLWDADATGYADVAEIMSDPGEPVSPKPWCRSCGGMTPWPCPTLVAVAEMLVEER